jgi:hypothetical protein
VTESSRASATIAAGEQSPSESISRFMPIVKGERMTTVMLLIVAVTLIVVLRETRHR